MTSAGARKSSSPSRGFTDREDEDGCTDPKEKELREL